ncbi:MAG: phosphoribosylformylglycinamidine synthase subunit PurS [Nitrososphaerota archaeon]|jgi:phosphoribosylformylglycinamidine synthase|nr:phosphoribosylformylglycinamidine synthase subunit PurS [Nitrososphaerota archaeon]
MKYAVKIEVSLKPGHINPEGETTTQLLIELGYNVKAIAVSKVYTVFLEASTKVEAETKAQEMCNRLLANPTKDNYSISIAESK